MQNYSKATNGIVINNDLSIKIHTTNPAINNLQSNLQQNLVSSFNKQLEVEKEQNNPSEYTEHMERIVVISWQSPFPSHEGVLVSSPQFDGELTGVMFNEIL